MRSRVNHLPEPDAPALHPPVQRLPVDADVGLGDLDAGLEGGVIGPVEGVDVCVGGAEDELAEGLEAVVDVGGEVGPGFVSGGRGDVWVVVGWVEVLFYSFLEEGSVWRGNRCGRGEGVVVRGDIPGSVASGSLPDRLRTRLPLD